MLFWKIFLKDILTDHMMHNANWWAFFKSGEIKIGRLVGIFKQIIPSYPWISLRYIIVLYFDKKSFWRVEEKTVIVYGTSKANTQKWSKNTYGLSEMIFFSNVQKSFTKMFFKEIGIYTCYRVHTQK